MRRTSTTVVRRLPLRRPEQEGHGDHADGDHGTHGDERWLVADSSRLLDLALELAELGLEVVSADRPRLRGCSVHSSWPLSLG